MRRPVAGGIGVGAGAPEPEGRAVVARPVRLVVSICLLGVVLTSLAAVAAGRAERSTEERLLEVQTRQAVAVLSAAVEAIQAPLHSALEVEQGSGGGAAGRAAVSRLLEDNVGEDAVYVAAGMWRAAGSRLAPVFFLGDRAATQAAADLRRFLRHALASDTTVVRRVASSRIAYAIADRATGAVVYAERAIPADRRAPVDRNSAFSGLVYAIYLGRGTGAADLATTNVDPATLPLSGPVTYRTTVPFGDTVLTLVTAPRDHLGSSLGRRLPWLLLLGGLLLTFLAALVAGKLARARATAEAGTATIRELYERVDSLYGEQRALFVALQRALLPQADPHIPDVEVAARYVAGAIGIDIGGDWYSVLRLDDHRFAFVVGDVSGRGVEAVAEMARARFTLRAYLVEGDSPGTALEKCAHQFDVTADGHIITALVGVADHRTGEVVVASAGHPPPLMSSADGAGFVVTPVGPPLGYGPSAYEEGAFTVGAGATLLCYTDGLVERRTEDIDVGLQRLVDCVEGAGPRRLPELIDHVLDAMRDDAAPDDTAVLAFRRVAGGPPV